MSTVVLSAFSGHFLIFFRPEVRLKRFLKFSTLPSKDLGLFLFLKRKLFCLKILLLTFHFDGVHAYDCYQTWLSVLLGNPGIFHVLSQNTINKMVLANY